MTTALAYWGQSYLHIFAVEPERALERRRTNCEIAQQFQLPLFNGQADFQIGWGRFQLGEQNSGLQAHGGRDIRHPPNRCRNGPTLSLSAFTLTHC